MPQDTSPAPVTPAVSESAAPTPTAPASSAAPAPASTESTGTSVMDSFDKQFSDFDAPAPAPTPKSEAAAPAADKALDNGEAPKADEAKTEAKDKDKDKPAADEENAPPKVGSFAEMRAWGKRMADVATKATGKVKELTAQIEELKSKAPEIPPDSAKIQADYERIQKENADLRNRVDRTNYAESPTYQEKFQKPYQQSYLRGRTAVQGLIVKETNAETGEVTSRPGKADDFDKLYTMSDSEADIAAEAMFGPSARRVIALRDATKERAEVAYNELKEKSAQFEQEKQKEQALSSQRTLALQGLWKKVNDDLQTKHEKWFSNRPEDKQWNEDLAKGREIALQRFSNAYMQLAPEQRVVLDAQVFNRASAFTAMRGLAQRLESQLAEANKTIEKFRDSAPGKPGASGSTAKGDAKGEGWEATFDSRL